MSSWPEVDPTLFLRRGLASEVAKGVPTAGLKPPLETVPSLKLRRFPPYHPTAVSSASWIPDRERIKKEVGPDGKERNPLLPTTIMTKDQADRTTRHRRVLESFALVDKQGYLYLPEWRVRQFVQVPGKYGLVTPPEGDLSRNASVSPENQTSEITFRRVVGRGDSVEAAIREAELALKRYRRIVATHEGINDLARETEKIFFSLQKGFDLTETQQETLRAAYRRLTGLLEDCGIKPPSDEDFQRVEVAQRPGLWQGWVSAGQARWNEAQLIAERYGNIVVKLRQQRKEDRGILEDCAQELRLKIADIAPGKTKGYLGTLIHLLGFVKVRPYRHLAVSTAKELPKAQRLIEQGRCQEAEALMRPLADKISQLLQASEDNSSPTNG